MHWALIMAAGTKALSKHLRRYILWYALYKNWILLLWLFCQVLFSPWEVWFCPGPTWWARSSYQVETLPRCTHWPPLAMSSRYDLWPDGQSLHRRRYRAPPWWWEYWCSCSRWWSPWYEAHPGWYVQVKSQGITFQLYNYMIISVILKYIYIYIYTVKPVYKDHPRETRKVVSVDRWSL